MEMPNEEIIRRYKQAKHKPSQIQILADLNACPKSKILEIISGEILDNHAAACATVPQEPLKKVEVVNSPLGEIDALDRLLRTEWMNWKIRLRSWRVSTGIWPQRCW